MLSSKAILLAYLFLLAGGIADSDDGQSKPGGYGGNSPGGGHWGRYGSMGGGGGGGGGWTGWSGSGGGRPNSGGGSSSSNGGSPSSEGGSPSSVGGSPSSNSGSPSSNGGSSSSGGNNPGNSGNSNTGSPGGTSTASSDGSDTGTAAASQSTGTDDSTSGGSGSNGSSSTKRSAPNWCPPLSGLSSYNTMLVDSTGTQWGSLLNLNGDQGGSYGAQTFIDLADHTKCVGIPNIQGIVDVTVLVSEGIGDCQFHGSKGTYTVHTEGVAPGKWANQTPVPKDRILSVSCANTASRMRARVGKARQA